MRIKVSEIKVVPRQLKAVLLATTIAVLAACDSAPVAYQVEVSQPSVASSSSEVPSSSSLPEVVEVPTSSSQEVSSSEAPSSSSEVEVEYTEWVKGDWTTEQLPESDTCRLVDTKTETKKVWSEWIKSDGPVETTETREVKEEKVNAQIKTELHDSAGNLLEGEYGYVNDYDYIINEDGSATLIPKYITIYKYRDLLETKKITLCLYETRNMIEPLTLTKTK